ncbi:antibiotic biosynthesis monooxygenase [Loktanella sp. 5RATIMAR09]|uniref:antibiotic biosynthesis monooxygenase family protein n=1 Tax=Loktanella sp. 5RATIMAR09 TaxID=1225655 RepID=UPI0006EB8F58|nr:antibiotic biosynthesis monooxygenase [Loktanella sp. 5RATIMAR09]
MHALFFEVRPKPGHLAHYFEHVALLRPVLAQHTGLAFLDRYASLQEADVILSHQLWESEDAIVAWRKDATHRRSQTAGRQVHFTDYRIRVGARVLHWTGGEAAPLQTSDTAHVIALYGTEPVTGSAFSSFESVNHKGQFIALATVDGAAAAQALLDQHLGTTGLKEAAIYSIRRDYGQHDRTQAPT